MIKNIHKWEKAVILLLNADGWNLTHTGKGFEQHACPAFFWLGNELEIGRSDDTECALGSDQKVAKIEA